MIEEVFKQLDKALKACEECSQAAQEAMKQAKLTRGWANGAHALEEAMKLVYKEEGNGG